MVNSESTASLGTSTGTLTTTGFVMIGATHSGSGNTSADASAGGSKAAIGAAVAVNVESETSTATTKRSINAGGYVTIMADNAGAGTADAKAGAQGADAAASSADAPKTGEASTADNQVGDQLDLASSEAPSDPDAANAKTAKPSAKTSKGQLNVAGAIGVNVETSSAQASIPNGLTITATGLLTVHTSNDTDGLAKGDGSATAGANTSSTSVGVGIAINYVRATNQATVGNGSVSSQGLTVEALDEHDGSRRHGSGDEQLHGDGGLGSERFGRHQWSRGVGAEYRDQHQPGASCAHCPGDGEPRRQRW